MPAQTGINTADAITLDPLERDILPLLPPSVAGLIYDWAFRNKDEARTLTEIRLRCERPLCLVYAGGDILLGHRASHITRQDIEKTLASITNSSYYAMESEFTGGYVTIPGGHRVGLAGEASTWSDALRIREISSMNFRVARSVRAAGDKLISKLLGCDGHLASTLVISPPGCGKTTLLRDLCRLSSEGSLDKGLRPSQVGIVDERSEIAACYHGVPQHDLGPRVDILDRCPKARGITMLLRSMGPGVIATDEIGSEEDALAVSAALSAGASILATCHGDSVEGVKRRTFSSWLVSSGYFERAVVLSGRRGPGTVEFVGAIQ